MSGLRASSLALLVFVACSSDGNGGATDQLQSSCVHENMTLERTIANGQECSNFSYSDCPVGDMGSECVSYCAFDICQSKSCARDADCTAVKAGLECQSYIVSQQDYGKWCGVPDCPKGEVGCPCREDGTCIAPDSYWTVRCTASQCEGTDSCPTGCRSGSLCCGGAFCGGDCIGTPCC